jgi:hypothetical protein
MVSQHIAKVPRARARLGSIPRLSARVSKSSGVRRIRLAAPACRAECSIGASRFESGDTHQTRRAHRLMRWRKRLRWLVLGPDASARTLHATADEELDRVLDLCEVAPHGDPEFVAQDAMPVSEAVS